MFECRSRRGAGGFFGYGSMCGGDFEVMDLFDGWGWVDECLHRLPRRMNP